MTAAAGGATSRERRTGADLTDRVRRMRGDILRIAARHGASNVRLFGSVGRGEATGNSDIDLLVDFDASRSLLDHAALLLELEELLGCPVDVATERGLKDRIRERVLREASPL